MPVALTIAGSDPSGGAGIQADLRTFAALGVAGLSVITALTVQTSQGVLSVHPVAPDILAAQLNAILEDTRPDAVKIGMLGGAAQVRVVADALRRFHPPNVVLDPVLASTGGVPLLDEEGRRALLTELLPLCDLVTPNLGEAGQLAGRHVHDDTTMAEAGEQLLALGAKTVLVKGGHLAGEPYDLLLRQGQTPSRFLWDRIHTHHTHG
ncbi:MAG: bifunctional hydroxymethylpyrimidine kinase/phosphomethylpyrimidine kinase, partial [Armatimonadetes bacterium]|nr:bifunctional hydroxymethylpyrimidine kinase/phosphomethylpyrimidine kinase [Armatimonadota bacterium]